MTSVISKHTQLDKQLLVCGIIAFYNYSLSFEDRFANFIPTNFVIASLSLKHNVNTNKKYIL